MTKKEIEALNDDELVRREFMRRFSTWEIPIENLDVTLGKLPNEERQFHYVELKEIVNKRAFNREIDDWLRRISRTLAMGVNAGRVLTDVEESGLRIMLLEVENFRGMLKKRAALAQPPKPLRNSAHSI